MQTPKLRQFVDSIVVAGKNSVGQTEFDVGLKETLRDRKDALLNRFLMNLLVLKMNRLL